MQILNFPIYADFKKKHVQGTCASLGIYLAFIISAYAIGSKYSCTPIADFYYWGGMLGLPILFAIPFMFASKLHIALRTLLAFINTGLGIVIWAWAFGSSGMYFLCHL